jgi:hypothetical protein
VVVDFVNNTEPDFGKSEGNRGGSPLPETTLILAIIETDQKITTTVSNSGNMKTPRSGAQGERPPTPSDSGDAKVKLNNILMLLMRID